MLQRNIKTFILCLTLCASALIINTDNSYAEPKDVYSKSGLSLPRFVSVDSDNVNVRAGPGEKYPVKWIIQRETLPVEVTLEYDNWRRIRDHEGQEGWVFHTLLSGKRYVLILGSEPVSVLKNPADDIQERKVIALLEPLVIAELVKCKKEWCKISSSGFSGWMKRKSLWGVYETENID